ncbi:MAG: GNAT family N-acetyltransferase [Caldilineaceae bacterium]
MEWIRDDGYSISTDKQRLDVDYIHRWLSEQSYWAQGRSRETVEQSIANSLCFGLYRGGKQVGFARVVTDLATFGWLCDVFVDESERGHALGKWLVQAVVSHPDLARIRRLLLATRDAHELYRKYGGFEVLASPERWMAKTQSM